MSDEAEAEFLSYAQNRSVVGSRVLNSREEVRALIEQHAAWGWTLEDFQRRAGVRYSGDTAYVTTYLWHEDGVPLGRIWAEVQAAHAPGQP